MGLDVSHGAWSGSYGAFARWREMVAEAAGYEVAEIVTETTISSPGHMPFKATRPLILLDWGHITHDNLRGKWKRDDEPRDPLILLFAHSDCDGHLTPRHARMIADRLEEIIHVLPADIVPGHIGDPRAKTQKFIDGCRAAHKANQRLTFS